MRHTGIGLIAITCVSLASAPALAGSHLWRFNEVFSNSDGTIQFIELEECCGAANEIALSGKWVRSDSTGNQYNFSANLPAGSTANKHLLLATAGFAALPGAPTPDHIIPDGFFDINGDTLRYWTYPAAVWSFSPGDLPTDGINSLSNDLSTGCNSPTNFAAAANTEGDYVQVNCNAADFDADGAVGVTDFLILLAQWGNSPGCPPDIDGGGVGVTDFLEILANWGPCP
ncbi:MAG: hypothetical protein ACYTGT_20015 [Planctomycetota bacterium]|jgi:hypothetical protein